MDTPGPDSADRKRGRIVMLVDNGVVGDSRAQKSAKSAAAAGWEVLLLGRSLDGKPHHWTIGEAEVRLVPVPAALAKRPQEYRRTWLRRPFAYPPTGVAAYRMQWARARLADLRTREAILSIAARSGNRRLRGKLAWQFMCLQILAAKIRRKWVFFRARQTTAGQRARKRLNAVSDRVFARFWKTVLGDRSWRRLEPRLWDFEIAFGEVVDSLQPDIIHANDFYMIGVGARAALRGRAAGRPVKLVWDAHELVSGIKARSENPRWLPAHCAHEREYAKFADATITVSSELAAILQEKHGLAEKPTVVLNAPVLVKDSGENPALSIRAICDVDSDTPLLVYSGAAAEQRGLDTMVESLAFLPKIHIALVVLQPEARYIRKLLSKADDLGVRDRVHITPYVPFEQVVTYISSADIGVIPIHHWPNHEIALITKFFEYAHAKLPIVVSDVRAMAEATRANGLGEVFRAKDTADFARAVRDVLADPGRYRSAYDQPGLLEDWTWEVQAKILDGVYTRMLTDSTQSSSMDQSLGVANTDLGHSLRDV